MNLNNEIQGLRSDLKKKFSSINTAYKMESAIVSTFYYDELTILFKFFFYIDFLFNKPV